MEKNESNELSFGSTADAKVTPPAPAPAPAPKPQPVEADDYTRSLFAEGLLEGDIKKPESWKRNTRRKSVKRETIRSQASERVKPYILKAFGYHESE